MRASWCGRSRGSASSSTASSCRRSRRTRRTGCRRGPSARTAPGGRCRRAGRFGAFARVRARRPSLRLVLTGWDKPAPAGVEARGRVAPDELVRLYRTAAALVFPSVYEGFGQPPLEAMACGCPVACSNAASLPEVVGDAARLFDPESVEDMAAAVEDVLDNAAEWARRGLKRVKLFSWDDCARRHDAVYRELSKI